MGRPTDWYVLDLDQDPTPGDPVQVESLAKRLQDFADDVGEALRAIRGLAGDSAVQQWTGLSGDEYRRQFDDTPKELTKLERSYRMCGNALAAYWPDLQQAQGDADRALEQGRQARADLDAASASLTNATDWVQRANAASRKYQDDPAPNVPPPSDSEVRAAARNAADATTARNQAQGRVDAAQDRLDAAKRLAADAKRLREDAADRAKSAIDDASDAGIQNKKWWQKAVDFVVDHWDDIVAVCKVVVAVLGVIVMIIGGPLAWVLLAAALVVLADTLIKYAQGKASLWDVAFAAMDCIPGAKGLTTLGGLAKFAKSGLKATTDLKATAAALRNQVGNVRKTARELLGRRGCGDPVDVATGEVFLTQTDVELPGSLPLVVRRTHISSYRDGRWFGRSWASTLDQRLELDGAEVTFFSDDGMVLHYPVPEPDGQTLPLEGPRWPLTRDALPGGAFTLVIPDRGWSLGFGSPGTVPDGARAELPLRSLTDLTDSRIEVDYGEDGCPVLVSHSGGYRLGVTTHDSRVTALTLLSHDEQPVLLRYGHDRHGDLTEVTNSSGVPLRFDYGREGQLTRWQDRNGTRFAYAYDDEDRCISTSGSDGVLTYRYAYTAEPATTVVTDSLGHRRVFHVNEALQVVREVDPLGHAVQSTWDRFDRLLSRTDPLGRTTRYRYDDAGNPVQVTLPDGSTTTVTYDDTGNPVAMVRPGGDRWVWEYQDGRLVRSTNPQGAVTRYGYDRRRRLTSVTDPLGHRSTRTLDETGRTTAHRDPLGGVTSLTRDAFGQVSAVTDPVGGTTELAWTPEGRLARRTLPGGGVDAFFHDGEGNLVEHRAPDGSVTRFTHSHFDRRASRTTPDGTRHALQHDTELRLLSVTRDGGDTWTYDYDAAGRLVRETDFDGRTVSYAYDPAGQLVERTNGAGQSVHYVHDLLGRVVERRSRGRVTTFAYGPDGLLHRAVGPDAEIVQEHDALGRLVAETCNGRTLTLAYDEAGRRTLRRTPSGATSTWSYDANNQPVSVDVSGRVLAFRHDTAGREVQRLLGDAAVLGQGWTADHHLAEQVLVRATDDHPVLQRRAYTYDVLGRTVAVTEATSGTRTFAFDAAGRIASAAGGDRSESYGYDANGNLTSATTGASTETLAHSGTLLVRRGHVRYEHDAQGRVVRRTHRLLSGGSRTWQYTWDAEDRLVEVRTPDGDRWRYGYDPFGRRVSKQRYPAGSEEPAERTDFTWDGARLVEQVTSRADTATTHVTTWDWATGTHKPLAQTERTITADTPQREVDARFHAIVTDLVGSPAELVDEDGEVVWRRRTTVWGAPREAPSEVGEVTCPLRFPGQYHDAETGLHYNYQRYYEPESGRYLTPDPLGLEPSPHPYRYVDDPLTWTDPLGLAPCLVGTQIGYNSDELSGAALAARWDENGRWVVSSDRNIAVARVEGYDGLIIGRSQGGGFHSEHHILQQLSDLQIDPSRITHLYSERQICPDICQPMLSQVNLRDDIQITYSVPWHTNQTPDGRLLNAASQNLLNQYIRDNGGYATDRR